MVIGAHLTDRRIGALDAVGDLALDRLTRALRGPHIGVQTLRAVVGDTEAAEAVLGLAGEIVVGFALVLEPNYVVRLAELADPWEKCNPAVRGIGGHIIHAVAILRIVAVLAEIALHGIGAVEAVVSAFEIGFAHDAGPGGRDVEPRLALLADVGHQGTGTVVESGGRGCAVG